MVLLNEITAWALELEEVIQLPHFDKISFRAKNKIFATIDPPKKTLVVKLTATDQSVFCQFDSKIIYPATGKWGKQGWTCVDLRMVRKSICKDALKTAYQTVLKSKTG